MFKFSNYNQISAENYLKEIDMIDVLSKLFGVNNLSSYMCRQESLILNKVNSSTYERLLSDAQIKLQTKIMPSGKVIIKKWEDGWEENLSVFCRLGTIESPIPTT